MTAGTTDADHRGAESASTSIAERADSAEEARLPAVGRTELGTISISDTVVSKIAARSAVEHPDAGAAGTRILGIEVPGVRHLGGKATDLSALPKTTVEVDGASVFVDLTISVRWPASVAEVTRDVRSRVAERVESLTGLAVQEVHITVQDLVTDVPAPPRVR